jgi:hypothetical protein
MSNGGRTKLRWQGPGGRLMGRGFRLMWAGLLIVPVLLVAALAHAPRGVIIGLLVFLIVVFFIGVVVVFIGWGKTSRAASESTRAPRAP